MTPTHIADELTKVLDEMHESGYIPSSGESFTISSSCHVYDDQSSSPLTQSGISVIKSEIPGLSASTRIIDQQGKINGASAPAPAPAPAPAQLDLMRECEEACLRGGQAAPTQQLDVLRECAEACSREAESRGRKFMNNELSLEDDPFRFYDDTWKAKLPQLTDESRLPVLRRASLPVIPEAELHTNSNSLQKPTATYDSLHSSSATNQHYQSGLDLEPTPIKGRRRNSEVKSVPPALSVSYSPPANRISESKSTSFREAIFGSGPAFTLAQSQSIQPTPADEQRCYLLDPFMDTDSPKMRRVSRVVGNPSSPLSPILEGCVDDAIEPESSKSLRLCFSPPSATPQYKAPPQQRSRLTSPLFSSPLFSASSLLSSPYTSSPVLAGNLTCT